MNERTVRAEMLLGSEAMEKLKNANVAVFGLGGVGSWCAEALARSGIGELTLVDQDEVGLSNINRQLCALTSTVGMPKAEVVRQRILDINPDARVHAVIGRYDAQHRDDFSPATILSLTASTSFPARSISSSRHIGAASPSCPHSAPAISATRRSSRSAI